MRIKKNQSQSREEYVTNSERETFLLAKKLSQGFKGDEVVFLEGELGTGKTVFAKGLAAGLGLKDFHQVCSPSYTLVNIYQAKFPIYHIDLYRLEKDSEIMDLGWEDYLGQGVIIVEWAEKVKFNLDAIRVTFRMGKKDQRKI
ncbi:MAG: tRNA (adenosine(37)-N6)-threonylcarbamoyltransferase complex ATPase subunit type 1 TsaE, partial [Candidatus Aminicenantes bacterium]|nr:tRNA (adenosine(37)-N6)-threonylcarbamoyltransferase complex ATPase subunit type 1 TsaE [Candidatus Aminicenantes bacterium]